MPTRKPSATVLTAAQGAHDRLLAELKPQTGKDATRNRRAVNAIFNIVDHLHNGDLVRPAERPSSVELNTTTPTERKIMRFWRAVEYLQSWAFEGQTVQEEHLQQAFNAIV